MLGTFPKGWISGFHMCQNGINAKEIEAVMLSLSAQ